MKLVSVLPIVLAFALLYVCNADGDRHRSKRNVFEIVKAGAGKVLKSSLKTAAMQVAKEGAMSFLEEVEIAMLKDMIKRVEYDKMRDDLKDKLLKVSLMTNATTDIYERHYECSVGDDYLDLKFHFGRPVVTLPEKWLLNFFN